MQRKQVSMIFAAMMAAGLTPIWAQDAPTQEEMPMGHAMDSMGMEGVDHDAMPAMEPAPTPDSMHDMGDDMEQGGTTSEDMSDMAGMGHGAMPDESSLPDMRDPHAYADGYDFSQFPMRHEGGGLKLGSLLIDRLEAVRADGNTTTAYDLQAWYGGDFDRAVLKAEGDADNGRLQDGRTEVLWGHAVSPFWDTQLGLRYDNGVDPDRGWLAFGIQGLAPYWFELDVSGYVGDAGRSALRLSAEYELLFTQKLILSPRIETNIYGKSDTARALGSGLSDVTAGIRLRYEIQREFAPYVGLEWTNKFGGTADYVRDAGLDTKETQAVAGVRFWF